MKSYLGWTIDFTEPEGEPAFAAPESVSWQVFKNPVVLAIGGICAVLLEFADARVRHGVWEHSRFRTDPGGRGRRTAMAAMIGVYGPQSAARRVIEGVTRMHARVEGETPAGEGYRALDPDLLDWVSATARYGFVTAYHRFAAPLSEAEQDRFYGEGERVAALYGARRPLKSREDFEIMLADFAPRFEPHPIQREFIDIMSAGQAAPAVPKRLHRALVRAGIDILPDEVRARLELGPEHDLSPRARRTVKAMARLAETVPDLTHPAAGAAQRLGLPRRFAWRSAPARRRHLMRARLAGKLVAAE